MYMKWNSALAKVLTSSALALTASTSLYAIPQAPCDPKPPKVCCEEPKPGPFAFSYPLDLNLSCPRDFYFHVDGLAFQAKQDGMAFGIVDTSGSTSGITGGSVEGFSNDHKDWDYNPGIRAGVGFYLDHDAWCIDFNWTWLNITNYKNVNASGATSNVIPLWLAGSDTNTAQRGHSATASWKCKYNTIDARLGRPFHVSRYLVLHPHFGVRGAWIDQRFSASYGGSAGAAGNTKATNKTENDFWGVGTRTGMESEWKLTREWSLFSGFAASILFGKFEIDQISSGNNAADEDTTIKYDYFHNTPNFEVTLGASWSRNFSKNRSRVSIRGAYEFHEWFNQLNVWKFFSNTSGLWGTDVVSRGDLTLNGFSLSVAFDI